MGCDIHTFIERRTRGQERWVSVTPSLNPGRNYEAFAFLAGVRNYNEIEPISEPRGFPEDAGWRAVESNTLWVTDNPSWSPDERNVIKSRAEKWIENGSSKWFDPERRRITDPDWHSHSWVTSSEWRKLLNQDFMQNDQSWFVEYHALGAMIDELERRGQETRVVFWFDN